MPPNTHRCCEKCYCRRNKPHTARRLVYLRVPAASCIYVPTVKSPTETSVSSSNIRLSISPRRNVTTVRRCDFRWSVVRVTPTRGYARLQTSAYRWVGATRCDRTRAHTEDRRKPLARNCITRWVNNIV